MVKHISGSVCSKLIPIRHILFFKQILEDTLMNYLSISVTYTYYWIDIEAYWTISNQILTQRIEIEWNYGVFDNTQSYSNFFLNYLLTILSIYCFCIILYMYMYILSIWKWYLVFPTGWEFTCGWGRGAARRSVAQRGA